jgi:hypothetical protein
MSIRRVWIPSPHFSSRAGATVRLIVLHTAEGAHTIESLGAFFQGNVEASSHVGADDKPGLLGEYVHRTDKAWAVVDFNPVSVNLELCGFASWSTDEWRNQHGQMLKNCAAWIAEEAAHYKIPIRALTATEAQDGGRGVCQHKDLGVRGGGHHDCGPGFPMSYVLQLARDAGKPPAAKPDTGEAHAHVICHLGRNAGIWEVHGIAGKDPHFGGPDNWEKAEIAVNRKTGKWRVKTAGRGT